MNKKAIVISLSGGMDSTCLLIHLLKMGFDVYALSFNYGQKHTIELERLQRNIEYLNSKGYSFTHDFINISEINKIFDSSLLKSGSKVPEGHYEQSNMKATVVPNRNAIFSSIIYGYALSVQNRTGQSVKVALGVHSGDHEIYPDCRQEFYDAILTAFKIGNWNAENVDFYLPYLYANKTTILEDCLDNCKVLRLDFDTVLRNTNTSYNPDEQGRSSGTSGADIERIEAFINIGRVDPVEYVKPWEEIVEHAKKVLEK